MAWYPCRTTKKAEEGNKVYNLGTGTTFDIKSLAARDGFNYNSLTANNFIVEAVGYGASGYYFAGQAGSADFNVGAGGSLTKTYSNGVLTLSGMSNSKTDRTENNYLTVSGSMSVGKVLLILGSY